MGQHSVLMALPVGIGYFCALVGAGMRGVERDWRHRMLWFSSHDANRVVLAGAGLMVMGLSLVMTMSRSGVMGFAVALAASGWVVARRQARRSRRAVLAGYLLFLALLSVGCDEMIYWIRVGAVTGLSREAGGDCIRVAIALQEVGEFSLQMPGNAALLVVLMALAAGRLPHRRASRARPGLKAGTYA